MTSAASRGSSSVMVPLFLVIAALCLLFADRATVVWGVWMLITWWQRQR